MKLSQLSTERLDTATRAAFLGRWLRNDKTPPPDVEVTPEEAFLVWTLDVLSRNKDFNIIKLMWAIYGLKTDLSAVFNVITEDKYTGPMYICVYDKRYLAVTYGSDFFDLEKLVFTKTLPTEPIEELSYNLIGVHKLYNNRMEEEHGKPAANAERSFDQS